MVGADWKGCEICGPWHKDAGDAATVACGAALYVLRQDDLSGSTPYADLARAARRGRLGAALRGAHRTRAWRKVRDGLGNVDIGAGYRNRTATFFVCVDGLGAATLPGALPCSWEDVFSAAQQTPAGARTGKAHRIALRTLACSLVRCLGAVTMGCDTARITPGRERFEMVATAGTDDAERRALRRALTLRLPEAWQVNMVDLWLRCGLAVDDGRQTRGRRFDRGPKIGGGTCQDPR